jgi:hypothetical protein
MSVLRRPTPANQILDLARRLAEEYASILLPEVSLVVRDAAAASIDPAVGWSGTAEGIPAIIEVIELVAREDLDWLRAELRPAPAAVAPRAGRRSGPRQGVG